MDINDVVGEAEANMNTNINEKALEVFRMAFFLVQRKSDILTTLFAYTQILDEALGGLEREHPTVGGEVRKTLIIGLQEDSIERAIERIDSELFKG